MNFLVRLFKKDILRKIVALFFAILLYWTISSQNGIDERFDNVVLNIHYPDGIVNVENKDYHVNLYCSGSKHMLDVLRSREIKGSVKVSIKNYVEGVPYTLKLTAEDFKLPLGVKIDRIVPEELVLNLEPRIGRVVKVKPFYNNNKLQDDYLVKNVTISPAEVNVVGPASVINSLSEIKTCEIPLDSSITDSFDYVAELDLPENLIVTPRNVNCHLSILKEFTFKEMNSILVLWQCRDSQNLKYTLLNQTVDLQLYGTRSDLEKIGYDKINAFVDVSHLTQKGTYEVEVKCFINGDNKVEIRNIVPKFIRVMVK